MTEPHVIIVDDSDGREPLISAERVEDILRDCLFDSIDGDPPEGSYVRANGIIHDYGFDPAKLEIHRDEVAGMLKNLPIQFRSTDVGGGGGWSFLNACQDANDVQWTGLHQTMEHLLCLGIAMDLAKWLMPRETWSAFPGGMPYVLVNV